MAKLKIEKYIGANTAIADGRKITFAVNSARPKVGETAELKEWQIGEKYVEPPKPKTAPDKEK